MANVINLALRGLQFFWVLLILALNGNTIALAMGGNTSIINYDMFVAVFAALSLLYLIPVSFTDSISFHAAIPAALDGINTLLFLIGGIALSAYLGVRSCDDEDYISYNIVIGGHYNANRVCHEQQAVAAFLWFAFASFLGSFVFSLIGSRGGGSVRRGGAGGIRRGPPAMSQV